MAWPWEIDIASRQELLREVEARWVALDAMVATLSDAELGLPVPMDDEAAGWTVGVAVAHLATWTRRAAEVAARQREPFDPDNRFPNQVLALDFNVVNAEIARRWRDAEPDAIRAEHAAAHAALTAALSPLPDRAVLVEGHPVAWLHPALGHSETHLRDHIQETVERHRAGA